MRDQLPLSRLTCILLVVAAAICSMFAPPTVNAACDKFCGFCESSCTTRIDADCGSGPDDRCLVKRCESTNPCRNILLCSNVCNGDPTCCDGAFVDQCGFASGCPFVSCPCSPF